MNHNLILLPINMQSRQSVEELQRCNELTAGFGLQLSSQEINQLVENRRRTLADCGRIEFGGGVIRKLILEFVDSPFLYQANYADTLIELQECFYYFKNEALDELSDDELIRLMKKHFDDDCQGSVEYLQSTILENYCRDIRYGSNQYRASDGYEDNYIDFYDWDEKEDY